MPMPGVAPTAASLVGVGAVAWTLACGALPADDCVQALLVPSLFLLAGLLGPVWRAAPFACRGLAAIGVLHLAAIATGSQQSEPNDAGIRAYCCNGFGGSAGTA